MKHRPLTNKAQNGIILISVLWMVAALSILVTGMVFSSKKEVQRAGLDRQIMLAKSRADAAINLSLQSLKVKPTQLGRIASLDVAFEENTFQVIIQPLSGLINLNNAPKELLTVALIHAAQLDGRSAEVLAGALIEFRSRKDERGATLGFEALEDLLSVPGFEYSAYAKLENLVTADATGSGKVNPMAAFVDVLLVLSDGNLQRAEQIAAARASGAVGVDTSGLVAGFVDASTSSKVMLRTTVALPDGRTLIASHFVDLSPPLRDAVPWRTFRTRYRLDSVSAVNP